jgi:type IV secretion system protein VirB10
MTFDPETLYAKPKGGRGVRPVLFMLGGVSFVALVGGILTSQLWLPLVWPDAAEQIAHQQEIKSHNSNTTAPPLNFSAHYTPAVYPPAAEPAPPSAAAATPPAAPPPVRVSSGPPKKRGIPEEERVSSLVLDNDKAGASGRPGGSPVGAGGVQPVADTRGGREGFYGAAGQSSDVFRPTGIVGQLGRCSLRPGSYIFLESAGVISSATPGQVTARTTRPIYAGPQGGCYAAPAGATLVGTFNANTAYGDERLQLAWTALILPNGRMIDLGGMPGAGGDGAAGLPADVNNHFGALAGAVLAGTAVDVVRGMASFGGGGNGSDVVVNLGGALADRSASVAEKLVDRELNRRPTMTAKAEELTVQVTRPIDLEPYRD